MNKKVFYNQCVRKGKQLVEQYKSTKHEICLLASKVCEIQKGGHDQKGSIYSMKRFATDIGFNHSTLCKWMEEHRNVVEKLGKKPKAKDWKIIKKVFNHPDINRNSTKSQVKKVYNKYNNYTQADHRLDRQIEYAKAIRNFLQEHTLSTLNQDDLTDLFKIVTISHKLLLDHQKKIGTKLRKTK